MTVRLAAFRLDAVNQCLLAYQALAQLEDTALLLITRLLNVFNCDDAGMAHVNSRDNLTSFSTAPPDPPVCQQVVQPMERVSDYPRMQCVDSGTQHSLVEDNKIGR